MNRRQFLIGAGGVAAAAAIAGCSNRKSPAAPNKTSVPLPTLVPYTGVKPDLPAGAHGVAAAHFSYPADPPKFIDHPMGAKDPISFLLQGTSLEPKSKNHWLQAIMKDTKADFNISIIASADYVNKFQVAIAGGNLPDVVQITGVPNLPQLLDKEFVDLSDYLSGDKIKEYPGLASIATEAWKIPMLNGRLWGVPNSRPAAGSVISTRGDLLKKFGLSESPEVNSGAEFMDLCKELSDQKRGVYAFGAQPNTFVLTPLLEMAGAPNQWKVEKGAFVSINETDEMKLALEQVANMWKAGYIHPDSFAQVAQNITWWTAGTTSLYVQSFAGWSSYTKQNPTWNIGVVKAPKWNGGGPADKILGLAGYGDYVSIRKADPSRVKEILRTIDYFAAPFGTQEFLTMNFGVKGTDYTLKGTDPVATERGVAESVSPLYYCGSQIFQDIYVPGFQDLAKTEHKYLTEVMPTGVPNPAWGLYSEAAATKGVAAGSDLADVQAAIIQGRKKLSDWDDAVKTWRQAAGDQMRDEYEKAYHKTHSGKK
ncbi:MAG TPA: extracellular solute-binding protein [Mycobacteriales bacterium]|nr:extracellular solute-binding protein [Mycobacteriales bacterium]